MPSQNRSPLRLLWQPFQLQPSKPDYLNGIRTILALGGPVAAGFLLGQPQLSTIPTIAALFVGIVSVSGTYRQQATATGMATLGVTLALLVANGVSGSFWLTIFTTFFVIFFLSLVSLIRASMAGVGLVTSMMFIISLAKFSSFPNLSAVFEQGLLCLGGGLWVMVFSSLLWIVKPYTPAAKAVADCYLSLGKLTQQAQEITQASVSDSQQRTERVQRFLQTQDVVIASLTSARTIWTSAWTIGKSESDRSRQLLVLIEDANQTLNDLVTLGELIIVASQNPLFEKIKGELEQVLEQMSICFQSLSKNLKSSSKTVPSEGLVELDRRLEALIERQKSLRSQAHAQTLKIQTDDYTEIVSLSKIVANLSELSALIHDDVAASSALESRQRSGQQSQQQSGRQSNQQQSNQHRKFVSSQPKPTFWLDTLKDNLTFDSVTFRHALRLALVVAAAQLLAYLLPIPRSYWMTLTALIALKPNFGGTAQTTGQRVLGTLVGGVAGIVLVTLVHSAWILTPLILVLMFSAISLRPLSYSLFMTLLTPVIVLLFSLIGMGDWEVGMERIVDVLMGGALALAGSYWLFPSWERQQLPAQLAKTIRANLAYFQIAVDHYLGRRDPVVESSLHLLRHRASLENANAEAAAQRLFSEPRHIRGEIEPVMTLMLYVRGLFSSVTALIEHSGRLSGDNEAYQSEPIRQLAEALEQVLINLADVLDQQQPLQPLPPLAESLAVINSQVQQLHTARLLEITTRTAIAESATVPTASPMLQAVEKQTPVATELSRIVRAVTIMYRTIERGQSNQPLDE